MPSMSPRTQQMQMAAGAGVDQATALFEKGFSDMAYNVLANKLPDLMQNVVTFKVLDTDIDRGVGVGAFIVMRGDRPLYVPVVMSDNAIKPLELAYDKALNIFLPLTKGWLDELDKTSLTALGKGIKTPESLFTDVDIRNIVVPPITGRFSYAAWEPVILADVAKVFTPAALEKAASEPSLVLLPFLEKAPNTVKVAFRKVLEKSPHLLKEAAKIYGVTPLTDALRLHEVKVAAKQNYGGGLWIADKDTTPTEFRRIFGDKAPEAYAGVRRDGYASKDDRRVRNLALQEQPYTRFVEPRQPGVYILHTSDCKDQPALVIPNPIDLTAEGSRYGRRPPVPGRTPLVDNSYYDPSPFDPNRVYPEGRPDESEFVNKRHGAEFLAVLPNGDYLETNRLAGRDSVVDAIGGQLHKRVFQDVSGEPKAGLGVWIRQKGTTIQATRPVEIKSVMTDSEGVRRVTVTGPGGWPERQVVTDPKHPYGTVWMPKGATIVYLPSDFVWVPLKKRLRPSDFFSSPLDIQGAISSTLASTGAKKVSIKDAGAGQFSVDGGRPLDKVATLRKVATDFALPVPSAAALLEKVATERHVKFWVVSPEGLAAAQLKLGADDSEKKDKPKKKGPPSSSGGDPMVGEGDPSMEGDPMADPQAAAMMAAQAAPPEPTPTDLAAMEMDQQIQQEIAKLQEKQQMLAMLTQRAHEIAGGAQPMPSVQTQAMGAPPPSQNLATGAPMSPPSFTPSVPPGPSMGPPPGMPGMDPMGGAAPSAQPGMDPMMAGAAPGGALPQGSDPSMMAGAPGADSMSGGDPSMMAGGAPQQPSGAMMGPDGPSAEMLAQQVNPQFLGGAAGLSPDVFDAAAVSSLAQSPAIREMVGQYLPNLEKALDNLGRVLLSLEMQEPELKEQIGEMAFSQLEDNLRSTFRSLGDLVLQLSQSAHVIPGQSEHASA